MDGMLLGPGKYLRKARCQRKPRVYIQKKVTTGFSFAAQLSKNWFQQFRTLGMISKTIRNVNVTGLDGL